MNELCPICIDTDTNVFTECNHGYCISCLCRIKKCAMCRNPLQRNKLCIEIKQKVKLINSDTNSFIFNRRVTATISRNGDLITRTYFDRVTPTPTNGTIEGISVYNFALNPDEYQPSGTSSFSRIERDRPQPYTSQRLNFNHPLTELVWDINN